MTPVAVSQEAEEVEELPPIVVEGASIAVTSPKKKKGSGTQASQVQSAAQPAGGQAEGSGSPTEVSGDPTSGQLLQNQGTSVTVVTGKELRRQQIRHVADALRGLPGVEIHRTGSNAGLTQVRIRGAEGNQTLVLIDGVEANQSADGEFDFSNLLAQDIERIEVLRGAQSALYGSGAIGGVINIVTRSGRGPLTLKSRGEGGSFDTKDGAASVSAGNDNIHGILSVTTHATDGFNISPAGSEDDGNQITSFVSKGGVQVFENFKVEGVVRHVRKQGDRDEEDFSLPPSSLVPQTDAPSQFNSIIWLYGLDGVLSLADDKWLHRFHAERNQTANDDLSVSAFGTFFENYEAITDKLRYATTYQLDSPWFGSVRHFFTGLVEMTDQSFTVFTQDGAPHERTRFGYAGEVRGEYWDQLFLTGSLRYDQSDVFENFTTWRTAASFKVAETPLRFHASAGTGVKYPTLFEQFGRAPPFFVPNPNLLPEESIGWDSGVEFTFLGGRIIFDATYFNAELKNKIRQSFPTVINVEGISHRSGVELAGQVTPVPGLTLSAAYTFLDATEPGGLQEVRRPRNSGRLDLAYAFDDGRGSLSLTAIYTGKFIDEPISASFIPVRVELDSYWLVNAAISYEVHPGVQLLGRVENLFDEDYQEAFGFETAGFAAYAGLRLTYEDLATVAWANGQ